VQPKITTTSTPSNADDPAIWIHSTDPSRSVIIGTDKNAGVFVWDLSGNLLQHLPQGTDVNNVDVRRNVRWGGEVADIVAANLRDAGKLAVFKVNPNYTGADVLMQLAGETNLNNNIQNDSYGFCLYQHPADSALYVFERPKSGGVVRQYRVAPDSSGEVLVTPVRDLNYSGSVAEGFVADDQLGFVYITEETRGIHKYFAAPDAAVDQIATFGEGDGTADDREGLALYACADGGGYLVLSSQGNDTFKIFERQGNNRFLKTILPLDELGNPGLGTDGLDVTSFAAPPHFPSGFLVAHEQDDRQFHLYDWAEIAEDHLAICVDHGLQLPLILVSPTAYEFGEVAIGDSAVAAFVIKNSGAAELIVSHLALTTSAEFHLQSAPAPFAIAPGDSSSLTVAFVPISAGVKNSILQVANNDGENPLLEIHLSGAAVDASRPQISVAPPTVDFGEVVVGDSAQAQLVIRNLGDAVLSVIEISLLAGLPAQAGDEFQIDTLAAPLTLPPLDSILVNVTLAPITIGAKNGAALIVSNDPQNDSLVVALSGSAITDPVSAVDESPELPDRIVLKPVYPNPFNAEAVIEYALPQSAAVRLVIYNLLGQPIRILVDGMESAGFKKVRWDGRDQRGVDVGSGIYYIILTGSDSLRGQAGSQRLVRKITLLK
jgi:3-phytase